MHQLNLNYLLVGVSLLILSFHFGRGEEVNFGVVNVAWDEKIDLVAILNEPAVEAGVTDTSVVRPGEKKRCRKFIMVMAKKLMHFLTDCIHDLKKKNPARGEFDRLFQCAVKCAMGDVKMIDDDGNMTNGTFVGFVRQYMKEEYHDLVFRLTEKCVSTFENKLDASDPTCTSYGNFIKCMQNFVGDQCTGADTKYP